MADNEEVQEFATYWESHLQVYRQPIVWLSRVLTTKEHEFVYLLVIMAFVNCLIMFFHVFPMPPLLFVGMLCLIISICLTFCLLTNVSRHFKLSQREEDEYKLVCKYIGILHYKIRTIIDYIIYLRKQEPGKFYGFGILLSILVSNFASHFSASHILFVTANGILLIPLIYHYELHSHIVNHNWMELYNSLMILLQRLLQAIQNLIRGSHVTSQRSFGSHVNSQQSHESHVTSQQSHESHVTSQHLSDSHVTNQQKFDE